MQSVITAPYEPFVSSTSQGYDRKVHLADSSTTKRPIVISRAISPSGPDYVRSVHNLVNV